MIKGLLLALTAILLCTSCVEYRINQDGYERYLSTFKQPKNSSRLDPRVGPKAKAWLLPPNDIGIYVGGDVRDAQYITMSYGIIYHHNYNSSFEFGIRTMLLQDDRFKRYDESYEVDAWDDTPQMFYFGGVFYF